METTDARSLTSATQEELRKKAVRAVLSGKRQKEVAQIFGVTEQAVCKWMKKYGEEGKKGLKSKKRGRPPKSKLLPWQCAQIVRAITDRNPEQLKLPFYLWTREAVAKLIKRRYQITVSKWTVGRYLSRWGFTPQKPLRRAYEQNQQEVEAWLKEKYKKIKKRAKQEKALIYWGDETGLRSDHVVGRTYGRRGKTPVIPGSGQRFGCNMISVLTNRGHLQFMVFKKRFRSEVFIEFVRRLLRQEKKHKIFLIVDRHPVHRSKKVSVWFSDKKERIELFYLPPYSPELNPDELVNQDVKSNAVGRKRAHNQNELMKNVRGYLRKRQRNKELVKKYFHEKNVCYAAE